MSKPSHIRSIIVAVASGTIASGLLLSACAGAGGDGETGQGAGLPTSNDSQSGICLMNNCNADSDCGGCSDERTSCMVEENRCVACDPVSGMGCPDGETCSSYGICAPDGQTCPTDEHGVPELHCTQSSDCLACSPMNQVCNLATGMCQACTADNTQHCLQSDVCVDGACSSKCPGSCSIDADCGQCGGPGNEAHACNAHKCAECSDTFPCAAGLQCVQGSCAPQCGIVGPIAGDCVSDEDCQYCGDASSGDGWACKKAINDGPGAHGSCVPAANGCSDLGTNVAVLPPPWSQTTNLCSNDGDCAGVGINYNVGQLVRDIVGGPEINLGITKVPIQDAYVSYDMGTCADVDITGDLSCGVCVPCQVDADCVPVAVDPLLMDLFKGDPLAQIAGSLLIDMLYGDEPNHDLNFYCQPVAAGYGVCAPCANPLQACGQSQQQGGNGSCDHAVCDSGGALGSSCDSCTAQVCANDSYCCDTAWDNVCVGEVAQYCAPGTCNGGGGGGGGGGCAHDECSAGSKLTQSCSACAADVCGLDSYCCDTEWDSVCVSEAANSSACSC